MSFPRKREPMNTGAAHDPIIKWAWVPAFAGTTTWPLSRAHSLLGAADGFLDLLREFPPQQIDLGRIDAHRHDQLAVVAVGLGQHLGVAVQPACARAIGRIERER